MITNPVSTTEHYDRMIDEIDDQAQPTITDPFFDTGLLRRVAGEVQWCGVHGGGG